MTDSLDNIFDDISNPLDGVEDVLVTQNWAFNRMNRDELFVEMKGRHGNYRMVFMWDEDTAALQFCSEYDITISERNYSKACEILADINSQIWLGHFEVSRTEFTPCFRHTQLFRGMTQSSGAEHLQDLMEIALNECDRHHAAFLALAQSYTPDEESMALAIMPVAGQS